MNQKLASGLEPFNEKSDRLLMKKKMYQMVLSWQAPRHVNSVANVLSLEYGEFLEICFKRGCGWSLIFNKKNSVSAHFCRFATNLLGSFPKYDARNTPTYYLLRTESVACCCYTHSSRKNLHSVSFSEKEQVNVIVTLTCHTVMKYFLELILNFYYVLFCVVAKVYKK